MKKWQRIVLMAVLVFSVVHFVRDVLQEFGVDNLLATTMVKRDPSIAPWWYWWLFNSYVAEILGMGLASYSLRKNVFGKAAWFSIVPLGVFLIAWVCYWLFL